MAFTSNAVLLAALVMSAVFEPRAFAQDPATVRELRASAESRQKAEDWPGAVDTYRRIVALDPKDKSAWLELGRCALALQDLPTAIEASRRASQLGGRAGSKARFTLARALAQGAKIDAALSELDRALEEAPNDIRREIVEQAQATADLATLRADARFAHILSKARPEVTLPPELSYAALGWAYWEEAWVRPDPAVVTNGQLRAAIESTGLPWRVRDRLFHIEFVLVPPGACIQGTDTIPPTRENMPIVASNNTPRHKVTISKPFYLARFELSFPEWNRIMGKEPSPPRLEEPLAEELARTVLASVAQTRGAAFQPDEATQLVASIDLTVEESLRNAEGGGDLRSQSSSKWWTSLAESITNTVAEFIDKRPAPSSTPVGGNGQQAPLGQAPAERRAAIAKAVAGGIQKFVHERGCRDAYPKHWVKQPNWIDDEADEAWMGTREVLAKTGLLEFRLPTEAEWEYAVRVAGKPPGVTNFSTYRDTFRAVDKPPPADGLGLFNMLGSAAEWCSDYYVADAYTYLGRESTDPAQPVPASAHCAQHLVLRGAFSPEIRDTGCQQYRRVPLEYIGIRLARSAEAPSPSTPYLHPEVTEFDAPPIPMEWAKTLEELPDPQFVTDEKLRGAILSSGFPWRVKDKSTGIELLLVPPGTYTIGHPFTRKELEQGWVIGDFEIPRDIIFQHEAAREVTIKEPFYLARFEQPFELRKPGALATNGTLDLEGGLRDAERTIKAQGFRLPTDVEWEVACRAGTAGHFYGNVEEITWLNCRDTYTCWHNPLEKKPNPLGFYGMIGSRSEPCAVARDGQARVYRGGECGMVAWQCSAWFASRAPRNSTCGLRVARNP